MLIQITAPDRLTEQERPSIRKAEERGEYRQRAKRSAKPYDCELEIGTGIRRMEFVCEWGEWVDG